MSEWMDDVWRGRMEIGSCVDAETTMRRVTRQSGLRKPDAGITAQQHSTPFPSPSPSPSPLTHSSQSQTQTPDPPPTHPPPPPSSSPSPPSTSTPNASSTSTQIQAPASAHAAQPPPQKSARSQVSRPLPHVYYRPSDAQDAESKASGACCCSGRGGVKARGWAESRVAGARNTPVETCGYVCAR